MRLNLLQQHFGEACLGAPLQAAFQYALAGAPSQHAARMDVYANNVIGNLTDALGGHFEAVKALVGEAFFTAMAGMFIRAHPPHSGCLYDYGEAFPAFIAAFEPVRSVPYLADVAAFEWAWHRAYVAADDAPLDPASTPDALEEALEHPRLRDDVQLVACTYPAEAIWRFACHNGDTPSIEEGTYHYLIHRPALEVATHQIVPPLYAMLSTLAHGGDMEEATSAMLACDASASLEDACSTLLHLSLLAAPS